MVTENGVQVKCLLKSSAKLLQIVISGLRKRVHEEQTSLRLIFMSNFHFFTNNFPPSSSIFVFRLGGKSALLSKTSFAKQWNRIIYWYPGALIAQLIAWTFSWWVFFEFSWRFPSNMSASLTLSASRSIFFPCLKNFLLHVRAELQERFPPLLV